MLIGMTYDLRDDYLAQGFSEEETAEFDSPETIAAIERALQAEGYEAERIGNIQALVNALAAGKRWDLVFNICEGVKGIGRESQVPALLEAYGIPFTFSSPDVLVVTMDKALAKMVVRDAGIPTADYRVVRNEADIARMDLPFPLFVKPLAEGTGKGISNRSLIDSAARLREVCLYSLRTFEQPALVETYLPGRDFTVGVIGEGANAEIVGVFEITLRDGAEKIGQSFVNKEKCERLMRYTLADDDEARTAAEVALAAYRALGCRDAGRVDLRSDAQGRPCFIEVNPIAGLHPTHSDLPMLCSAVGIAYDDLIGRIVRNSVSRVAEPARDLENPVRRETA
ncbi:MAG: D-alanine--D-alanine ligase [Alphaproteobacteria bacterium]|nr:D-alanine--D-alanine ligase [Alphaproteobacteria bacterium]